jgi:hypothetical protein
MSQAAEILTGSRTVPDSGTGELMGLTGAMTIELTSGKHYYHFDYFLP